MALAPTSTTAIQSGKVNQSTQTSFKKPISFKAAEINNLGPHLQLQLSAMLRRSLPAGFVWKVHHPVHLSPWFPIPPILNVVRPIFSDFPLQKLGAMDDFLDDQASFIVIHGWVIPGSPEGIRNMAKVIKIYCTIYAHDEYIHLLHHLNVHMCEHSLHFTHLPNHTAERLETDDPGQTVLQARHRFEAFKIRVPLTYKSTTTDGQP